MVLAIEAVELPRAAKLGAHTAVWLAASGTERGLLASVAADL